MLVSNNGEPPILLRNNTQAGHGWVGLRLVPTDSNPGATGATVSWRAGDMERSRYRASGGSFLSSHDPREILGLGVEDRAETIEIRWPSGTVDVLEDVAGGAYHNVIEGRGIEE